MKKKKWVKYSFTAPLETFVNPHLALIDVHPKLSCSFQSFTVSIDVDSRMLAVAVPSVCLKTKKVLSVQIGFRVGLLWSAGTVKRLLMGIAIEELETGNLFCVIQSEF
jgi:hypothetical protein